MEHEWKGSVRGDADGVFSSRRRHTRYWRDGSSDVCSSDLLVETQDGVARAAELARRPLSRVYVGLNDLRIDRGAHGLFTPLVDGTVDAVRAGVPGTFGVGGLTLPEGGAPVPAWLLAAELVRLGADFTFLRRSFTADMAGRDPFVEVPRLRAVLTGDRESTRLNSSHANISYAVFCLKKKKNECKSRNCGFSIL